MAENGVMIEAELPEEAARLLESAGQISPGTAAAGVFIGLLLFGGGLLCLLKPDLVWEIQHLLTVQGGEPTDFYRFTTRISGGALLVLAVWLTATVFLP